MDATDKGILEIIEEVPGTSTRVIAVQINVPHLRVCRHLKDQLHKPYHLTTVQELLVEDYPKRIGFCDWLLMEYTQNVNFIRNILFTDEATFSRNGIINHYNEHI
ncbi:unnamed protein product [Diabrotica balteata]|uniref:Uncharacterized protein n=1 Tax=Diabrotica balteata TaxID=107213 RepID=A0A9N9T7K4_DIABA|nr:unnamed protein product [Diabrotica balteata]